MISVTVDGIPQEAMSGERLIDVINRAGVKLLQVCYHPQLGPIETCDTCMVAPCVTTTTETVISPARKSCWRSNMRGFRIVPSRTKRIVPTLSNREAADRFTLSKH